MPPLLPCSCVLGDFTMEINEGQPNGKNQSVYSELASARKSVTVTCFSSVSGAFRDIKIKNKVMMMIDNISINIKRRSGNAI